MRILLVTLLIAGAGLLANDGEKEGRRGNELYQQGSYGPAVEAYRRGLAALDEDASIELRYGLQNNLGAALLKSEDPEAAGEVFSRALAAAPTTADIARTAYNAGNASYSSEELETSLAYYRQSLLREPDNEDAKFNYEFVKRRLQQQQEQQQQQQDQQQDGDDSQQENQDQNQSQGDQEQDQQQADRENEQQQDGGNEQQQGEQPNEEQPEQPQSGEAGEKMSDEQAQRILQALQNEEEQLLREVQRKDARPRRVEKDW